MVASPTITIPRIRALDVRLEGDRILILEAGRLVLEFPAGEVAETLARAIVSKSRQAEEVKHADRIALDQGILIRAGANIGITSHPKIQAEAAKKSAWNRDLRRYMPGGVKSQEQFGTPAIKKGKKP